LRDATDGPNANAVSVVISQDPVVAALDAAFANYANVCYAMGIAAGIHVGRNIGRVLNGALDMDTAGLSDNTTVEASAADLDAIDALGYILRGHSLARPVIISITTTMPALPPMIMLTSI